MYRVSSISKHCSGEDFNSDVKNYDCFLLAILLTVCEDFHISLQQRMVGFTAFSIHYLTQTQQTKICLIWADLPKKTIQWYGVICSQHAKVYPYLIYLNFFIKGTFSKLLEFKRWKTVNLLTFSLSDDKNVPVYSCVEPLREQSCVCSCTANFGATMLLSRELKSLATSESLKRMLTNAKKLFFRAL